MKRPTLSTIAKLAGCSTMTVSLALRNEPQISGATREKIQRIALEVGYMPDGELNALMARVRGRGTPTIRATLAIIHLQARRAAESSASYAAWRTGAQKTAAKLGFALDHFWIREDRSTPAAFERVLKARAIRGLLILSPEGTRDFDPSFHPIVKRFAAAIAGYPPPSMPQLPLATNDRYGTGALLWQRAQDAGYERIGIVLGTERDERFSSGLVAAQNGARDAAELPVFEWGPHQAKLRTWMRKHRPDCIITNESRTFEQLRESGHRIPDEVGFIFSDVDHAHEGWSGTMQNNDVIGEMAVRLINGQIHRGEHGCPTVRKVVMVQSTWIDGATHRAY